MVEGKGSEHLTGLRQNRSRPASVQAESGDEVAIVGPERVGLDVDDIHRLAAPGGGAAGDRIRANRGAVDRLCIGGRPARRGTVAEEAALFDKKSGGQSLLRRNVFNRAGTT